MTQFDVLGIGNALVDVLSHESEAFVERMNLNRGTMTLIDEDRAHELYGAMGPGVEISGGSAANTIVGLASFGASAAYLGKVRDDQLGEVFAHDISSTGVMFKRAQANDGPSTGRCLIVVTPDAQRTMNTFLGASAFLCPDDVDAGLVASARVVYLEGYLWDPKNAKDAFVKAAKIAHDAKRKVALTLSDSFCVDRYRDEFLSLMRNGTVDIVFANESELHSLYMTSDFDTALKQLRNDVNLGVVTRSEKGCMVVSVEDAVAAPAARVDRGPDGGAVEQAGVIAEPQRVLLHVAEAASLALEHLVGVADAKRAHVAQAKAGVGVEVLAGDLEVLRIAFHERRDRIVSQLLRHAVEAHVLTAVEVRGVVVVVVVAVTRLDGEVARRPAVEVH